MKWMFQWPKPPGLGFSRHAFRPWASQAWRLTPLAAALFAVPFSCFAQTQSEVKGKKIIDACVQALGGQKFLTMSDRVESGRAYSYYRDQISGLSIAKIYTRYITVAPDKTGVEIAQRERQAFGKDEDSFVLFVEKGAWNVTFRGAKELEPDQLNRYRETTLRNIFYILRIRLKEPGMIFEARGSDVVEHQPVDIVDITDSENRVLTVDFNQTTHLPVKQAYARMNQQFKEQDQEVTLYSRYQDSDGIEWPHEIHRERNGEKLFEMFSESVKFNIDLTDDLFSVPEPGMAPARKKRGK